MGAITTIVLSKDRPAQLDLLLQSLEVNGEGRFDPWAVIRGHPNAPDMDTPFHWWDWAQSGSMFMPSDFESCVRLILAHSLIGEHVCFMCDDGILYRPVTVAPLPASDELCFSLRLGANTIRRYPSDTPQEYPGVQPWNWTQVNTELSDFGYPGSLDGHVFRTDVLRGMLAGRSFPNPTALECCLMDACLDVGWPDRPGPTLPLMRSFEQSVYVGNPVNRVSEQSGVRFGQQFPAPAAGLAERFATGDRLDLGLMDFSQVDGAHSEVELRWASERVQASV